MTEAKAAKAPAKKSTAQPKPVNAAGLDRLRSIVEYHSTHGNAEEAETAKKNLEAALSDSE